MTNRTIYTICIILGLYIAAQLIADVGATRFLEIGGVVLPGGTFIFALSFTLRDLIHKRLGKMWAHGTILSAVLLNGMLALYFAWIGGIPTPGFYAYGPEWTAIFGLVPAIVLGSMLAEFVSQTIDTEVYHRWWQRFPHLPQWTRVLVSNAVSLPIDSVVFSLGAFVIFPVVFGGEPMDFGTALLRVASGQTLYKLVVAFVSMPLIYLVSEKPLIEN